MKKIIAAVTTAIVALALSVAAGAVPASAQTLPTPTLRGVASCNTTTGTWTVNWTYTVSGVPDGLGADSSIKTSSPSGSTFTSNDGVTENSALVFSATAADTAQHPGVALRTGNWSVAFTQSGIPSAARSAEVSMNTRWTDGSTDQSQGTLVQFRGYCAKTPPPPPAPTYVIVAWTMPSWVDSATPTWPQTLYTSKTVTTTNINALDSTLVAAPCGTQYQVDVYNNSPVTSSLLSGGVLNGENSPAEDLVAGTPYKLVAPVACPPTNETGTATTTVATCAAPNANSVTLPAVPGGIWSWSANGGPSTALAIGTGFAGAPSDLAGYKNYTFTLVDGSSTDHYTVTGSSATWSPVDVSALDCNTKVTPGDPAVTPELCTGSASTGGTITVDQQTGLVYTVTSVDGTTDYPLVNGVVAGLAPGDYLVSVTALPGYELAGAASWPLTVTVNDARGVDCLPTLPVWNAGATGSTAICTPSGAAGTITLDHETHQDGKVDYKLTKVGDTGVIDLGTTAVSTSVAPGDYVVTAFPAVTGDGLVDDGLPAGATVNSDGSISFPVTVAEPDSGACGDLPTDAAFDASASGASTCLAADGTSGTITLGDTAPGRVDYTITNNATNVTTDLGTTTFSVKVAPGSYTVGAHVVNPADTILEFGAASGTFPAIVIAAGAVACGIIHTLAFTGVDPMVPLTLAGFLVFLGLGVMLMRRRVHNAR